MIPRLLQIAGQPRQRTGQRARRLTARFLPLPQPLLQMRERHRQRHDHPGQRQREQHLDQREAAVAGSRGHRRLRSERLTTRRGSKPPRSVSQKQCTVQRGGAPESVSRSYDHEEPAAGADDFLLQPGPSPAKRLRERRGGQPRGGALPPENADALEPLLGEEGPGGDRPAAPLEPGREQRGLQDAENAERQHDHRDQDLDEREAALRVHGPPPGRRDRAAPARSPAPASSGRPRRRRRAA